MTSNQFTLAKHDTPEGPVRFVRFDHIHREGLWAHGISTRVGGVSPPPYNTLNLGFTTEDQENNLEQNRRRMTEAIGLSGIQIRQTIDLVHGNLVVALEELDKAAMPLEADGIVTRMRSEALTTTFADCVPIILADPVTGAFGVIHGGWRGTFASIAAKAVKKMEKTFGCLPGNLLAGIGPGINRCCFEVGEEVADAFFYKFDHMQDLITESSNKNKWHVDILGLNRLILIKSGLCPERIVTCNLCTRCRNDLFFSYRRDGQRSGRMAAVMARL